MTSSPLRIEVRVSPEPNEPDGQVGINRKTAMMPKKRSFTGTQSSLEVPESHGIKLEELPLPVAEIDSTDKPRACSSFERCQTRDANTMDAKEPPKEQIKFRPDYKSIPLQWLFLTFLIALIVGLFVFVEYQIHDLPPMHYSMIHFDAPESQKAIVSDIDARHSSAISPLRIRPPAKMIASPNPEAQPGPRPPESIYPAGGIYQQLYHR